MSDFGESNAISNSNNLINSQSQRATDARVYNQQQLSSYQAAANTGKSDATEKKAENEGILGTTGVSSVVSTGKTITAIRAQGLGSYIKAQPGLAKANLQSFTNTAKTAFGQGTAEASVGGVRAGAAPLFSDGPGAGRPMSAVMTRRAGALGAGTTATAGADRGALRAAGANGEEGGGLVASFAKNVLGKVGGLGAEQAGALAKGVGAFAGVGSAALTGIEDIASGSTGGSEGKSATGLYKAGQDASMIAGGLDLAAMAVPILAPVAGVANVVSGIMGISGAESEATAKKTAATTTYNAGKETASTSIVSQTAAGDVATQSTSQRSY